MSYTELAKAILRDAESLDAYIAANNLPKPSLDIDGPANTPFNTPEASKTHSDLLANIHELFRLVQGPMTPWKGSMNGATGDAMTYAAIYKLRIAEHVPLTGSASFAEVAEKVGMALRDFKAIVRYAMTNFVFCEPKPGFIAHTASSKILAENKLISALAGMGADEILPGTLKEVEVLRKYPGSEEPTESSWALANNAKLPFFAELQARHSERAVSIAFAMEMLARMVPDSIMVEAYDWESLGPATFVDIGGGKGFACQSLARHFPQMSFIVQDLESTIKAGQQQLPPDFKDRIEFMTHDFFTPQPVKDADVYYFRAIFHDWPDKYCIQILQSLIPALKKGARIIIHDPHTPDPLTMHPWQERESRASNLRMKVLFNSHDRETGEYPDLLARADPRFRIVSNTVQQRVPNTAKGLTLAVVEAVWDG